jgi:DNA-binding SARP family transcriptional activator/Tfp pilus assembly protein PilF
MVTQMGERGQGLAGGLIRAHRREAGLTQQQLADAAGVSVGVVRDVEQGRTMSLQAGSARRLAVALGLDRRQAGELSRAARGPASLSADAGLPGRPGGLQISVLGPLAAWRRGAPVALGPPMQRAVLGLLALHAGTGPPRSAIIDALWGDDPPVTAVSMVQSYISRLRWLLGPGGPLAPAGNGYQLQPAACELDLLAFAALVRRAADARAAGELAVACEAYAGALALWRGDPLADVDVLRDHPAVARLSQQRADAVTGYAEAASAAGWHDAALPALRELAGREPLHERAHARLMIALAGSGQQAAALGIYDQVRRRLDDQLGVLPGAELADAHARVLSQQIPAAPAGACVASGPAAAGATAAFPAVWAGRAAGGPIPVVPRQLPGAVAHFTGRAAELAALDGLLGQAGDKLPGTPVIWAIAGTAGVGKTALAVHWAHQVAGRFPDGQLYVNLRGYDPGPPMTAGDALAGLLRTLGVPGQDIPPGADERAGRYRSLLAGRRMLVLLDNAGSAEQARPLLPGEPACIAIVTSRDALAGLIARDGARRLDLDLLPSADAVGLLRALIGARVTADPGAAAALAGQCCRLPLALRVAAELAAARPDVPLASLVGELADQQRRLDLLDAAGDSGTAVRAVFSWSCRHLDPGAARAFRLAGLHPGPDLDPYAAAALTGTTLGRAGDLLDVLARAHLIQAAGPGRHVMHDLLRGYARDLAAAQDGEDQQHAALTRLFDHYLYAAATAMDALFPAERHRRPRISPPVTPAPPVDSPDAARAWLDAERANLVAVCAHTAEHGWPGHTTRIAATLFRYLDVGGHFADAVTIHGHARSAASQTGDRAAEAEALTSLSVLDTHQGRYQQAAGHLQQSVTLHREAGNLTGQARALCNLGIADLRLGRHQLATGHLQQSLALFHQTGDRTGEANALTNLGFADFQQGRYRQATGHLEQSLALQREAGDRNGQAHTLCNLGIIDLRQGRYRQATGHLQQALALFRETGNRNGEADVLANLGDADFRQRRYQQAAGHYRRALALARETGDQSAEAEALNGLGEVLLATGQPDPARIQHAAALRLAIQIGDQDQQARAHNGHARAHHAASDHSQARRHWQQALTIYADLGAPEADQIRAELAAAGDDGHREP